MISLERDEVLKLFRFTSFNYQSRNHTDYTKTYINDYNKNGEVIRYTDMEVYRDILIFGCGVGCRFGDIVNLKLDNYQFSKDRTKGHCSFFMFWTISP